MNKHLQENISQALFLAKELLGYQSIIQTLEPNEVGYLEFIKDTLQETKRYIIEREYNDR